MIEIAKILKPHGINGCVKLRLYSNNFDDFASRGYAYIQKDGGSCRIGYSVLRTAPPFVYVQFDGIDTRTQAETLSGVSLFLPREAFAAPDEGEHYIIDLIGISIIDENGEELGVLNDVLQHGAADVYVVKGSRGFMFPAIKRVIESVDIKKREMRVRTAALNEVAVYDDV